VAAERTVAGAVLLRGVCTGSMQEVYPLELELSHPPQPLLVRRSCPCQAFVGGIRDVPITGPGQRLCKHLTALLMRAKETPVSSAATPTVSSTAAIPATARASSSSALPRPVQASDIARIAQDTLHKAGVAPPPKAMPSGGTALYAGTSSAVAPAESSGVGSAAPTKAMASGPGVPEAMSSAAGEGALDVATEPSTEEDEPEPPQRAATPAEADASADGPADEATSQHELLLPLPQPTEAPEETRKRARETVDKKVHEYTASFLDDVFGIS
jgi:hypothetical protein